MIRNGVMPVWPGCDAARHVHDPAADKDSREDAPVPAHRRAEAPTPSHPPDAAAAPPMTASDASVRGQPAAGGLAVMVVLHDLNEAIFVAGRLVACGPPA